ncbi:MAG: ABC-2 family transporter protein [Longilinea sp.]|nr:ABC-2 family transporter protein [Longilinea sp.]
MTLLLFGRIVGMGLRQQMAYRLAMWAGLATNLFFGLLRVIVLIALYQAQLSVNGMSLQQAITYSAVAQSVIAFLTVFGSSDLMRTVYSGAIATDLMRPVGFYGYWLARDFGGSLVNLVGRGLVFLLLFRLFYAVDLPNDVIAWLCFGVSLALGWWVSFSWRFLVNLASFWTPDALGVGRALFGISQLFSGFIMPLRLMPDWFRQWSEFTPFPSMVNTPIEVYVGLLSGAELWRALLWQAGWALALFGVAQLVYAAGIRRLVLQGG